MTHELIIDNFAGGGGASTGIEAALGRPVGLAWFSPDCTHFSKAKGGKPVKKKIRGLAWVVLRWAAKVKPRVIMLENVEEFVTWGPLVRKDDGSHYPCPKRKGQTFNAFISALKKQGYAVEYKALRACDYGAPTIRKRLFLIARCDGRPIVWPEPTHGDPKSEAVKGGKLKPWRTAAECIDWSIPCPSIFERKRPLAEATLRRIAKGIMKYVINSPEPFIVTYYGDKSGEFRGQDLNEPLRTQTTENRHAVVTPFLARTDMHKSNAGCFYEIEDPIRTVTSTGGHALIAPTLIQTGYGEREGQAPRVPGLDKPLGTVVAGGAKHALVEAFLTKFRTGAVGSKATDPMPTITAGSYKKRPGGNGHALGVVAANLVTSHLVKLKGTCRHGQDVREPLHTVTAGGLHFGEVRAFLMKYYGNEKDGVELGEPMHTVTSKDHFGLVTVHGEEYRIADIGMRMLAPRELFRAQGFPDTYIIDRDADGKPITKTQQVAKCGNSVCPDMAAALVMANVRIKKVARQFEQMRRIGSSGKESFL